MSRVNVQGVRVAPEDGLRADVSSLVLRFIAGVVLHNQAVSQRVGLGVTDAQFLNLLMLNGPLTAGALATISGLSTGSATGVIDRLERDGYARRERDRNDRRKVLVTPVPEALARLADQYQQHGEHLEAVLRRRDAAQLRVIAEFLAELNDPDDQGTPAAGPR